GARRQGMAHPPLFPERHPWGAALVGTRSADRVRPHSEAARPAHPPAAVALAPPGRRFRGPHGAALPAAHGEPPGGIPDRSAASPLAHVDGAARPGGGRDVVVHALSAGLLAPPPPARSARRRPALLPRPGGRLRIRAGAYGAVPRLPRARRAAGRAAVLRLPVRVHR